MSLQHESMVTSYLTFEDEMARLADERTRETNATSHASESRRIERELAFIVNNEALMFLPQTQYAIETYRKHSESIKNYIRAHLGEIFNPGSVFAFKRLISAYRGKDHTHGDCVVTRWKVNDSFLLKLHTTQCVWKAILDFEEDSFFQHHYITIHHLCD